jgi:hypothetical protein
MWLPVHAPCPVVSVPLFPARDQAAVRHFFPQSAWAVRIARPLVYVVAEFTHLSQHATRLRAGWSCHRQPCRVHAQRVRLPDQIEIAARC